MTLLVVVAHPDDETFGCGSLLLHAADRNIRTVVVCATRGEAGEVSADVSVPPDGLGALREAELREAAKTLGVAEVEVLDHLDSGMEGDPSPGSLCATEPIDLAAELTDVIERHQPDVVVTLAGDDGHRDHSHLRLALEQATSPTGTPLYAQCLPRSLMHEWVLDRAADQRSTAYVDLPDIGTPDADITTVIDTDALYPQRLQAIARHRSQHSPYDDLPEELRRRFLGAEHLIRLSPPWSGGPTESDLIGW